jgi:hypothetical protein
MKHRILWPALVLLTVLAGPAGAQTHAGIRAGASAEPDQFFFGGHVETAPLLEQLTFRPNVEIGVGDDLTTIALNIEFVYSIPLEQQPWRVYAGGGPAANIYTFGERRGGGSDVGGGFHVLVGVQHAGGLFTELKVGAIDSPNLKFTVGYAFR